MGIVVRDFARSCRAAIRFGEELAYSLAFAVLREALALRCVRECFGLPRLCYAKLWPGLPLCYAKLRSSAAKLGPSRVLHEAFRGVRWPCSEWDRLVRICNRAIAPVLRTLFAYLEVHSASFTIIYER